MTSSAGSSPSSALKILTAVRETLTFIHNWFSNESIAKVVVALLCGIGFSYVSSICGLFYVVVTLAGSAPNSIFPIIQKVIITP